MTVVVVVVVVFAAAAAAGVVAVPGRCCFCCRGTLHWQSCGSRPNLAHPFHIESLRHTHKVEREKFEEVSMLEPRDDMLEGNIETMMTWKGGKKHLLIPSTTG